MPTFNVDPSSDIGAPITGWTETGDNIHTDLSVLHDGGSSGFSTEVNDDETVVCRLGGVTLPSDFPADGADSITYAIRMRMTSTKNISPTPTMSLQITTSGNAEIAQVDVAFGGSPGLHTEYTGSMSITGNNTSAGWTDHRFALLPTSNDTDHTTIEISKLQAVVTYTASGGSAALIAGVRTLFNNSIIQPPMIGPGR